MAEISDPTVWSTLVQTVVLTLTLAIFILTFREQNKATRESAYQKVLDDYTDSMKMLVENPILGRLPLEMARIHKQNVDPQSSQEDLVVRNYMLLVYGIFERTHLLYRKKWIDNGHSSSRASPPTLPSKTSTEPQKECSTNPSKTMSQAF